MRRVAIVTGASGGLGRAVARRLAADGWSLVIVGRDLTKLGSTAAATELAILNGVTPIEEQVCLPIEADVSTARGADTVFTTCVERFGAAPRALVQAAGSVLVKPLHATSEDDYRACLAANLDTSFYTLRAFARTAREQKAPTAAVLISSVAARVGVPRHEVIAAAKAGVEALVRTAALSYADRTMRINGIAAGLMRTPATERFFGNEAVEKSMAAQYPLGRWGETADVTGAVAWLLSEQASWVTGQILAVDGGFSATRPLIRA